MYLFALMKDFYNNNLDLNVNNYMAKNSHILILYNEYHTYKITISHPLVKLNLFGVVFDGGYDMAQ